MKELRLKHEAINDPQTITQVTTDAFENADLDIHRHGVESLVDDFSKGERILQIKNTKYHFINEIPWHKK